MRAPQGLCSSLAQRLYGQLGRRRGPSRLGFAQGEGRATTASAGYPKHGGYILPRINMKIGFWVPKVVCIGMKEGAVAD